MAERIKLGGLWLNKTKDGREYLTGRLSPSVKILIFKNNFRNADNQPSHIMYLAPVEVEEGAGRGPAATPGESFFNSDLPDPADRDNEAAGSEDEDEDEAPPPQRPMPARPAALRPGAGRPSPAGGPVAAAPNAPANRRPGGAGGGGENPDRRRPARPESDDLNDLDDPFAE